MKAVLFDLGHTLINYHNDWREPERRAVGAVARMVVETGGNGVNESVVSEHLLASLERGRQIKMTEMIEIPLTEVLDDCFLRFSCGGDEELMVKGLDAFYAVLLENRRSVPGTKEMLETLKDEGYRIGLVSDVAWGLPSSYPQIDMRHYHLREYFDDLVFSTDVGLRKPNPRIFKIALANVQSSPKEAVYVGNNLQADIKGALGVGMKAILKESDFFTPDNNIVPSAKISTWDELLAILNG
ncbi:MAG TPA: HAD family hydrolase [Methanomassiliicoccales archaeon]|nr:HAD family hydrolase [Methanomassiliicoccales archaeon]